MGWHKDADDVAAPDFMVALHQELRALVLKHGQTTTSYDGRSDEDVVQQVMVEILNFLSGAEQITWPGDGPLPRTPEDVRDYAEHRVGALINCYRRKHGRQNVARNKDPESIADGSSAHCSQTQDHPYYDRDLLNELLISMRDDRVAYNILLAQIYSEYLPRVPDFNVRCTIQLARYLGITTASSRAASERIKRRAAKLLEARKASDAAVLSRAPASFGAASTNRERRRK